MAQHLGAFTATETLVRAPMAAGFMVAWWEVWGAGPLGRWWAVTASWLGSCCC
jgi:hypothetical protein